MLLEFVDYIKESTTVSTHIEHPEDLVFAYGSKGAAQALQALNFVIAQPKNVTIKWDGYPALIFGRNHDGQLVVVDKHMFTRRDGTGRRVAGVDQFVAYDQARGVNRADLYKTLAALWPAFEQAVPADMKGYYWCDLLWVGVPGIQNNKYTFKPNTVTYHVPVASTLGKRIAQSVGGIVVHQYFPDFDSPPQIISSTGKLNLQGRLCILTPDMKDKIILRSPVQQLKQVQAAIKKYGAAVDALVDPINLASIKCTDLPNLLKQYINARVRGVTQSFYDWVPTKLSLPKQSRLLGDNKDGYLYQNYAGIQGAFAIWEALESVKNNVVAQLDSQQKTIEASVNNVMGGEGYVVNSPAGLIKLINRAGFSAANFAKNP